MDVLLDTQILVWIGDGDQRLTGRVRNLIFDDRTNIFVSSVTAWEYADLENRGRFVGAGSLGPVLEALNATLLDYPAVAWKLAATLPDLHRDPVDRMLIAHAIHADLTLVTADAKMRAYPVKCLW